MRFSFTGKTDGLHVTTAEALIMAANTTVSEKNKVLSWICDDVHHLSVNKSRNLS